MGHTVIPPTTLAGPCLDGGTGESEAHLAAVTLALCVPRICVIHIKLAVCSRSAHHCKSADAYLRTAMM